MSAPGGEVSAPGGCLLPGGSAPGGLSAPRECLLPGGCLLPEGRLLLRAVRILLECILVIESFTFAEYYFSDFKFCFWSFSGSASIVTFSLGRRGRYVFE